MTNDPIADLLTRIRNGGIAGHKSVDMPTSTLKLEVVKVLQKEGFIKSFELLDSDNPAYKNLRVVLKYDKEGYPLIRKIKRVSRPGLRQYRKTRHLKSDRVLNGAGIAILSTSHGIMTDRAARKEGVGGEILCTVE